MPIIQSQLRAIGRKEIRASSKLPKLNQRKKKTISEQAQPM